MDMPLISASIFISTTRLKWGTVRIILVREKNSRDFGMKLGNKDNRFKSEYPIKRAIFGEGFSTNYTRKLYRKESTKMG